MNESVDPPRGEGGDVQRSKGNGVNVLTYLALAAGVLIVLNVLFVALVARVNRSADDSDEWPDR